MWHNEYKTNSRKTFDTNFMAEIPFSNQISATYSVNYAWLMC